MNLIYFLRQFDLQQLKDDKYRTELSVFAIKISRWRSSPHIVFFFFKKKKLVLKQRDY